MEKCCYDKVMLLCHELEDGLLNNTKGTVTQRSVLGTSV